MEAHDGSVTVAAGPRPDTCSGGAPGMDYRRRPRIVRERIRVRRASRTWDVAEDKRLIDGTHLAVEVEFEVEERITGGLSVNPLQVALSA